MNMLSLFQALDGINHVQTSSVIQFMNPLPVPDLLRGIEMSLDNHTVKSVLGFFYCHFSYYCKSEKKGGLGLIFQRFC